MDTEALTKQRVEELLAGYTVAGKAKRKPSAHNKMVKALMKKYGYTLGQASKEASRLAGGSVTAGSSDSNFYDPDKYAAIREERARRRAIEDMELATEEGHAKARENALANDPRYGQYIQVEKDYKDKKKALKALKEKELSPEQKRSLRLQYEKENPPKFSELSDVKYTALKSKDKTDALTVEIEKLQKALIEAKKETGSGRKKK